MTATKPFPPSCLEKEGPAHGVEEGPKPHNPPSTNPQAPTQQTNQRMDISHPVPNWTLRASECDAARPYKPNPSTRQPGMSRAATGHANREDHDKKHSPGGCLHALRQEVETNEADLDMNWARPEKQKRSRWI